VRTSTFLFRISCSSIFSPARSRRLFSPLNSTRMSMSLSFLSSPLTKEPNMAAFLTS